MAQKSVSSNTPRRGPKEFIRKFFVGLKRSPQNIAMVMMLATFLIYSLNLTNIAKATESAGYPNMGQCEFISMLLGILAFVSFLRAFPRREKPKMSMIVLTVLMDAAMIFCDIVYNSRIKEYLSKNTIDEKTASVPLAGNVVTLHIILLIISIALIVLLPVYSKLIKKINTSIDVEGNDSLGAISIEGEE